MSASLDLKRITDRLKKSLSRAISPEQMKQLGEFVLNQIKDRSREGFGVDKLGGSASRFPALSPEYIARRKKERLSPFTSPGKSNITRTGKLLGSLRVSVKPGSATIFPAGSRNGEKVDNKELADILQTKMDRPFMSLSAKQLEEVTNYFEANFSKLI